MPSLPFAFKTTTEHGLAAIGLTLVNEETSCEFVPFNCIYMHGVMLRRHTDRTVENNNKTFVPLVADQDNLGSSSWRSSPQPPLLPLLAFHDQAPASHHAKGNAVVYAAQ
jgi:hypothetical protein